MKKIIIIIMLFNLVTFEAFSIEEPNRFPGDISGEISLENRYFFNEGLYSNTEQEDISMALKFEYSHSWDQERKVISIIPYAKLSELDDEKTHFDLREFSLVAGWEKIELRAGVSKVFWGVTESLHLVDVVNQTDAVENTDGEDKLGQPMLNITYVTDYGNFDYFFLPYFRERTFAGQDGRLRGPLPVDTENPHYLDSSKEKHIDHAFRWTHYLDSFEWGISYFNGTDREPGFEVNQQSDALIPVYRLTEQVGLELQYEYEAWLFKSEILHKDSSQEQPYFASAIGFEYTLSNKFGGMDIGFLYEWLYDERDEISFIGNDNAHFVGNRLALNDEKSTEFIIGGIFLDQHAALSSLRFEGSRRINENWKWEVEAVTINSPTKDSPLNLIQEDDYVQFTLSYYF